MNSLPEDTVLTSRAEYASALSILLGQAQHTLCVFDPDLSVGGFETPANVDQITNMLVKNPATRITLIVHDARHLLDRCPRLLVLMQRYQHAIKVYETNDEAKHVRDSFVLADDHAYLRRFHVDQMRFKYSVNDKSTVSLLSSRFEELLQATHHQISTTPLGL